MSPPVRPRASAPILVALVGLGACSESGGSLPVDTPVETQAAAAPMPQRADEAVQAAPPPVEAPSAAPAAPPRGARIYSKARFAWIQPQPRASRGWIGYLGLGGSVALRGGSVEKARVPGYGCDAWYAVEPQGYVCAGDTATVDPRDPVVVALGADGPRTDSPWPYEYAESIGVPRYPRPPSADEQQRAEWDLADHLRLVEQARAGGAVDRSLAGVDLTPAGAAPAAFLEVSPLVRESRPRVANGSTVAYTRSFDLGGRTFLVTHDHAVIPSDRVRPYPRSDFHGVELGGGSALPIAFFRKHERPKYQRGADGAFVKTGESWPRLASVGLTGDEVKDRKRTFLATREPGVFVLDGDASVARAATSLPATVRAQPEGSRRTWLDVSVMDGTLVAYEGETPVFATLISPGRGGVPYDGKDPLETASTPTGTFRVDGKFVTATMVSSTNDLLVHTEVQFVQNFHGPHALHGAYWHDAWGELKSGGCVNLAPADAKRVFLWGEPTVPEGWYGLRSVPEMGIATIVVIHR